MKPSVFPKAPFETNSLREATIQRRLHAQSLSRSDQRGFMTLLQALRNATRASHERLDRQISGEDVTANAEAYARYLARFHDGLAACWPQLDWGHFSRLGLPQSAEREARYHALTSDLRALGRPVSALGTVEEPEDPAAGIGCLYVLEGSIHGGTVLLAELEQKAGPLGADVTGFLRGFGDNNRSHWKDFVSWLESLDAAEGFLEAASTSAAAAFGNFIASFGAPSPTPLGSR